MISRLYYKLLNREYRRAFVASQINIGIPFQLRALLKASMWTQQKLAEKTGMLQPRISAMLKSGGAKFTLETLQRLAAAFDVALLVKFIPFSELAKWSESFDPDEFFVPTFSQEQAHRFQIGTSTSKFPSGIQKQNWARLDEFERETSESISTPNSVFVERIFVTKTPSQFISQGMQI